MRALMKRSLLVVPIFLAGIALWLAWEYMGSAKDHKDAAHYDVERHIRYGFTLHNASNRVLEGAEFWTYVPVRETSTQRCCVRLESSMPYELKMDDLGNQVMHIRLPALPPYSNTIVQISAELRLAETGNAIALGDIASYLGEERFVEVGHPRMVAFASRIQGDSKPAVLADQAYDLVKSNLRYSGYVLKDQGALRALSDGEGDCTEFMYLFMALARGKGVPARGIGGYVYAQDAVLKARDYHNWAEFHADGAWHIADAQKGVFARGGASYIAMRILGAPGEGETSSAHRFWHTGDGLEVRMN
jgi:hypothetical protein